MKLATAILVNPPRTVNTKFGQKTVIDAVRTDNNEAVTLWRPANDDYCQKLGKNSRVTVGIDSKGKTSLVEDEVITNLGQPTEPVPVRFAHNYDHKINQNTSTIPNSDPNFSPAKKTEIAEYVQQIAKLYQHCQDQAENIALTPDDARAIATTLFIQTVKHFNL